MNEPLNYEEFTEDLDSITHASVVPEDLPTAVEANAPALEDPYVVTDANQRTIPVSGPYVAPTVNAGGYPYPTQYPYPGQYAPASTDGLAIAALVSGIAGMTFVPLLGSVLGIIFGIIALGRVRESRRGGRGLAIAGIATGAAGLLLGIAAIFAIISFINFGVNMVPWHMQYWM
jgi:hypothetical protein